MKLETIVTRSHTYFPLYVFELSGVMIIAVPTVGPCGCFGFDLTALG